MERHRRFSTKSERTARHRDVLAHDSWGQTFARWMVSEQLRYPMRDGRQTWEERYDNHCSCASRAGVSIVV